MATELHPAGPDFIATILDHSYRESKVKGTLSFCVIFETEHGTIYGDLYMTEKTIEKTIEKMRAMGWEGTDLQELNDGTVLRGKKCRISVEHEEYDGKMRARVGWINPIDWQPGLSHDEEMAVKVKMFNKFVAKSKKAVDKVPF